LQMRRMTSLQRLPVLGGILRGARTQKDNIGYCQVVFDLSTG